MWYNCEEPASLASKEQLQCLQYAVLFDSHPRLQFHPAQPKEKRRPDRPPLELPTNNSRVTVIADNCRAALGLDGRGAPVPARADYSRAHTALVWV